jgi:membrane associated rhomboid family serine protease
MLSQAKQSFIKFDTLQKIIAVNVVVFVIVNLGDVLTRLFNFPEGIFSDTVSDWVSVPSALNVLATRPWSVITYCFYHEGFFHILFNMLWLFYMGRLFTEYLGEKKLLPLYLLGGLCGALLFILFYNIFPYFSTQVDSSVAIGASASVLAITVAIATLLPDYEVAVFLPTWRVKLKYIAIALFVVDLLSITGSNAGGNIAHIGGAVLGFIFTKQLQKGNDITAFLQRFLQWISGLFSSRNNIRVVHRKSDDQFKGRKNANQQVIDKILDKISRSGYSSLSNEEKDILFKASKNTN